MYFSGLSSAGMLGPDEPRYASVGREMAQSGDWITPRLWGAAWFEKPALLYWMTAAAFKLGFNEDLAPRVPVAVLAIAFLIFFQALLSREFGARATWTATVILGTSAAWLGFGFIGTTDLPMTAAFSAAMLLSLDWIGTGNRRRLPLAAALLGVAALAKGLVPLVLTLPLLWCGRRLWRDLLHPAVIGAFLIVAAPWYVMCYLRNGPKFVRTFFWQQHFERFTSESLAHGQPFWFYLPVLAAALLPWTPLLFLLPRRSLYGDPRRRFLLLWMLFVLVFFSFSKNKLPGYILPMAPAAAALIGIALWEAKSVRWVLTAAAVCLVAIPAVFPVLPQALAGGLSRALSPRLDWTWFLPIALALAIWWLEGRGYRLAALATLAAASASGVMALKLIDLPAVDHWYSARPIWKQTASRRDSVCVASMHRSWRYGLNYYSVTPLPDCSQSPRPLEVLQSPGQPPALAEVQSTAAIHVNTARLSGRLSPIYAYFGYDEPNFTYTKNGRKLIRELAALSPAPVYIRTHFLLATGDGTPGLKWGSTNAYTEDAAGRPVYDWTIVDRIFDTYLQAGAKPFVEIGFMPKALSVKPDPYQPTWIPGARNEQYSIGWSYPPKDYGKWGELVYQWVRHAAEKYGRAEVESWYWEVWNEPDISYWHGTPGEYDKLYDYAARAVKRAIPGARVGGPATTGPSNERAGQFLRQFLEHCAASGVPLDFITYHAKGRPTVVDGHVRMGMAKQAADVDAGFRMVASFEKFRNLPIVLSESDPEGCAACSARVYPPNAYRNGTLYPAYTAAMMKKIYDLAKLRGANIAGMLTWAFEFEDQPYFDGFRTLATNGIDKPVLNIFRMAGMMRGDRTEVESTHPAVDALAARGERTLTVLIWNYDDDDVAAPDAPVQLRISGLPTDVPRVMTRHYRIDQMHSNSFAAWKQMGSPQQPTPEQYTQLESAGQLQLLQSQRWIEAGSGEVRLEFGLPRQGISLVELSW